MEITCDKCQSKFKIPDNKIPAGKTAALKCPKCKEKIMVGPNHEAEKKPDPPQAEPAVHEEVYAEDYDAADKPFDFVEEEGRTALVCESDPGLKEKATAALQGMDYHITEAESGRDALKKMRYHVYDLVLVNEEFDTSDPDSNGVMIYLERLSINFRRNIFVIMMSKRFRTLDSMMAFNKSVNMIVNVSNINEIDKILRRGMTDHDIFYRIFTDGLRKAGRI
jgi:predicted Zn finger-like uncharacterized protein